MTSRTREEVLDELARVASEAIARGEDGMKAVENMGVPTSVAAEAWVIADRAETERWWQQVERTIDGETIRKAIGGDA
ncbi:hypothetical protein H9Q09_00710 [Aurantimonas sp. DM33-3]|uniref:hypothetical protein n=1 Tax=Aurantimonas sp. DM33-3 TaxID=2766955 RepID=UPI001651CD2D|nr:hypothetical protein [Aurantimonas sp. DM33-3]MBC6714706.1 hypothetical protein [Aurantimonas sp. DM33-3]